MPNKALSVLYFENGVIESLGLSWAKGGIINFWPILRNRFGNAVSFGIVQTTRQSRGGF